MKGWLAISACAVLVVVCSLAVMAQADPSMAEAPKQFTDASLERYWSCMERNDLQAIKELLWQHKNIERVDASIFGLPKDDFDDDILLTIEERVWYRAERIKADNPLPDEGPIIYPHHLRETLDHLYIERGQRPNCAHELENLDIDGSVVAETIGSGWVTDKDVVTDPTNARGEVHITVDRQNEARVFISTVQSQTSGETSMSSWRSTDWGANFTKGNIGNNAGSTWECDPCGYYQRSVNPSKLYESKIGCNTGSCTQTYVMMRVSTDNGASFTDCARPTTATTSDRQMHVVDNTPTSPCYGNIYLTWHDSNSEKVVRSTAAQNCTAWGTVTSLTSSYQAITPDIATGPDGRVYATWGNYGDSTFKIAGSSDCGVNWNAPSNTTLKSYNGTWKNNVPAQCVRGVSTHPQVDVDRCPWSAYAGTVYVVMQDYNTTGTDLGCSPAYTNTRNYDLFFTKSTNNGTSWSAPVNITSGEGSTVDDFHFMMRVDETDGSIYIGWIRSRLNPTSLADRQTTNYVMKRSIDGGATWSSVYTVSSVESNERLSGASTFERGDYESIDVYNGVVWPAWIDRRGATSTSPEHVITRKICTEPTHRSERAPTFTAPPTTVTAGALRVMNISWTAPDAFWGDANENNSARKYQLWVDGVLAEDNILWTATSTTWTAADCTTSHSFVIRAVNQCGVSKDYGSTSLTATGCCANNPSSVAINPAGPLTLCQGTAQSLSLNLTGGTGPFTYQWTLDGADIGGATSSTYSANTTGTHSYNCRVTGSGCSSGALANSPTQITWYAMPAFAGVATVTNPSAASCTLNLAWSAATAYCGGPIYYNIYRSTSSGFTPGPSNRIATGVVSTTFSDIYGLTNGTPYYYIVRAVDSANGAENTNTVEGSATPFGPPAPTTLLSENFDSWSAGTYGPGWAAGFFTGDAADWTGAMACTGQSSPNILRCGGSNCTNDYGDDKHAFVRTPQISVPAGSDASRLSFYHRWIWETDWDGGYLRVSLDGTNYTYVPASALLSGPTYNTTVGAWSGTQSTMTQTVVDLDAALNAATGGTGGAAGQSFYIAFVEYTDTRVNYDGWFIDNVVVTANAPATCSTSGGVGLVKPVPDGSWISGTPIKASKNTGDGSSLNLTWDVTTCVDTDYNAYYGVGSAVSTYTLTGNACTLGNSGSATWNPAPAVPGGETFLWWVLVGTDGVQTESSWGKDSAGNERHPAASAQCGFTAKSTATTCP